MNRNRAVVAQTCFAGLRFFPSRQQNSRGPAKQVRATLATDVSYEFWMVNTNRAVAAQTCLGGLRFFPNRQQKAADLHNRSALRVLGARLA